ncbi:hypothetical protein EDD21DRAFT_141351 [Dissophora ornata]|nr:hypothetical protein EDD21DRAFT_141351 [Dissophora ornata]
MAANKLALFCLVDGESTAFEVEIDRNASISRFKDAIFDKIDNTGFKAKDLVLWRVTIPFDENAEDEPILLDGLNVKTKLGNPRTRLSELFPTPESLDDNTYIIVQPPRGMSPAICRQMADILSLLLARVIYSALLVWISSCIHTAMYSINTTLLH